MLARSNFEKFRLPVMLLCILLLPIAVGDLISLEIKSFFYSISLTMKSILVFLLPFIIFSFLSHSIMSLGTSAVSFVILLLAMVSTSNFIGIMSGFTVASTFLPYMNASMPTPLPDEHALKPLFDLHIPKLISNEPAIIAGIFLGLFLAFRPIDPINKVVRILNNLSINFLKKVFLPVLPLFILGFVFKLEFDQMLSQALHIYGPILFLVVSTQICYICLFFLLATNFSLPHFFIALRNILPASITGFSTISSAATMPVTIMATEKNLNSVTMARTLIPATANIHTVGSALGLTILCIATMRSFFGTIPTIYEFIEFALFYTLAKYAVAGIPGGVVLVVTPLLESYLGFTPEMIGLITAVYLLFDPFGTAANVTCNGAFAMIFNKVYKAIGKYRAQGEETSHVNI